VDTTNTAVFVLKLVVALGPLAIYFLTLGLINSQARPYLLSARTDFTLLAIVCVPIFAAPALVLIEHGYFPLVTGVIVVMLAMFFGLLPRWGQGWVMYNCSSAQCRRLLQQACRRLGWQLERDADGSLHIGQQNLRVTTTELPWLRSVTLRIDGPKTPATQSNRSRLIATLNHELSGEAMLASATGISLVVIGVTLLGVPMWYLFHHMDAIVDVVRQIFFA